MPKYPIILENVPKDDNTFLNLLPREGRKSYNRLSTKHPTPFIFVEYASEEQALSAVEAINNHPDSKFVAKRVTENYRNQSSESVSTKGSQSRKSSKAMAPKPDCGICVLCEKPADFMCERCRDPYCSPECQKLHWNIHRPICRRMPNLVPYEDFGIVAINKIRKGTLQSSSLEVHRSASEDSDSIKNGHMTKDTNGYADSKNISEGSTVKTVTPQKQKPASPPMTPPKLSTVPAPTPPSLPESELLVGFKKITDIPRDHVPKTGSQVVPLYFPEGNNQVFLRSTKTGHILQEIMKLCNHYAKTLPALATIPVKSGVYLGAYNDEGIVEWYRVIVTSVNEVQKTAIVGYFDYGNQGILPFDMLKEIPDELMELPRVTFRVKLEGLTTIPNDVRINKYKEQLMERIILMNYTGDEKTIDTEVTLYDLQEKKRCINLFFMNPDELATTFTPKFAPLKFTHDTLTMKYFTVLENVDIMIQFDDTLVKGYLYFCLLEDMKKISDMEKLAGTIYESNPEPYTPDVKELCFVKHNYEGAESWYRVVIQSYNAKENSYVAYFVDYGNYDNVSAANIRPLAQEFINTECSLISATVDGIAGNWPMEKIEKFRKIHSNLAVIKAKKIELKKAVGTVLYIPDIVKQL